MEKNCWQNIYPWNNDNPTADIECSTLVGFHWSLFFLLSFVYIKSTSRAVLKRHGKMYVNFIPPSFYFYISLNKHESSVKFAAST